MKVIFVESHNLDRPDPVGSHQYIKLFKEAGHDCLWLGPSISPFHLGKPDPLNRYRFQVWREGLTEREGIKWLVPFSLLFYYNKPLLRSLWVGRNQYRFCLPPLKKTLEDGGFAPVDLIWCAGPPAFSLLDIIPHRFSCYRLADRLDQFGAIPGNVTELQKNLIKRVDFVLATSQALLEWAAEARADQLYLMPNGVSDQFFTNETLSPPDDLPQDGRPVALYVGTIDTRFDLEALCGAVRRLPEVNFVLIGPVTDESLQPGLSELKAAGNLTTTGPKPYDELPAYMQNSTVGLIPFRLNDLTEAVNPIKYYEYLASGLPVVAPPMRELAEMQGPIHYYRGCDDLSRAIGAALNEAVLPEQRAERINFAAARTWRSRFKEIEAIIAEKTGQGV